MGPTVGPSLPYQTPFKPAATCDLHLLSWKTLFLVAITSAWRVSELAALDSRREFLSFLPHAVRLSTHCTFLPKVVSAFHLQADLMLPDFYPNPTNDLECLWHTLDVTRALKFYLHRTRFPNRDSQLLRKSIVGKGYFTTTPIPLDS